MRRKGLIYGVLIVLGLAAMASYVFNFQAAEDAELTGEVQQAEQDASGANGSGGQAAGLDDEIARTKHLQEQRKAIMDEMVSGGIAERIENPAGEPFVYVMEPFYRLTKAEQSSLLNVIWSYYITEDRNADAVTVYDNATGQEIGTYSQAGMKIGGE
ncbi:MAG TPA: hypothetical protein PKC29_15205 [Thermodesulfobacteriota bacterium]|nr:hypothetical protein [Thermodesulfobacteriota bacterium]